MTRDEALALARACAGQITLHELDAALDLEALPALVLGESWDHQWSTAEEYLAWPTAPERATRWETRALLLFRALATLAESEP